jgi:hypothetical protein
MPVTINKNIAYNSGSKSPTISKKIAQRTSTFTGTALETMKEEYKCGANLGAVKPAWQNFQFNGQTLEHCFPSIIIVNH